MACMKNTASLSSFRIDAFALKRDAFLLRRNDAKSLRRRQGRIKKLILVQRQAALRSYVLRR
jgi:hypothetical protein